MIWARRVNLERSKGTIRSLLCSVAICVSGVAISQPNISDEARLQDKKPNSLGPLTFKSYKTGSPPNIDGDIVADEWGKASTASKFIDRQHRPEQGRTTFYLQYDDQFVYLAAIISESHPPKATVTGTNVSFGIDDIFVLQLDTFGEGRLDGFNYCSINGRGATNFRKAGGSSQKREWRGSFEGSARVTPDGWSLEARVPWSILRMPKSGVRDLRFNFARTDSKIEESFWYFLPKELENVHGSVWEDVEVPPVQTRNLWKFLPSIGAIVGDGGPEMTASLDLRGFVNDKFEFSGVLFPDFSLISRAATPLGFSHFEILRPETRPLFQEGSGYFQGVDRIFTSQRIGKFDFGGRFYGSPNPSTRIGVNSTLSFDGEATLAARLTANQGPNQSFSLGFASIKGRSQQSNDAIAASFRNSSGPWSFGASGAASNDQESKLGTQFGFFSDYRSGGFSTGFNAEQVDKRFLPRLGFVPETGVRNFAASISYGFSAPKKWFSGAHLSVFNGTTWTSDGRMAHESNTAFGYFDFRKTLSLSADVSSGSFDGVDEDRYGFYLNFPNSNAPWSASISNSVYQFGESRTDLRSGYLSYTDPANRWAISGGITQYTAKEVFKQRQLSFAYKLGPYDNLSISMLTDQGTTNYALQYSRQNNEGAEYWFSIGDPSAAKFRPVLIARLAFPIK